MASASSTAHLPAKSETHDERAGREGRDRPPPDLRLETTVIDGQRWCLLSHPLDTPCNVPPDALQSDSGAAELPPGMRAVAILAMQGLDNAAIASARGTSVRTVAKQLECIYRRLGIGSRLELLTRFGPGPRDGT